MTYVLSGMLNPAQSINQYRYAVNNVYCSYKFVVIIITNDNVFNKSQALKIFSQQTSSLVRALRICKCLRSMALTAAEAAAHTSENPDYSESRQTVILSTEIQLLDLVYF